MSLTAIALNCTLKTSKDPSSTEKLLKEVIDALAEHKVTGEIVRVADLNIKPGVTSDEGEETIGLHFARRSWPQTF